MSSVTLAGNVTDPATGASGSFSVVVPLTAPPFTINATVAPLVADAAATRTITVAGNGGAAPYTFNTPTASGITFTPVSGQPGKWTFVAPNSVTVFATATDSASASANAAASITSTHSVFTTQVPAAVNVQDSPTSNYELGMKFTSSAAGNITAIKFWKGTSESGGGEAGGPHVGNIWSAAGALLATVTFANETASGWQTQQLGTPVPITAGTTYVVTVATSNAFYVATNNGLAAAVTNGPLSSIVGGNGVYGPRGAFPTQTFQASNYFRDVVVS